MGFSTYNRFDFGTESETKPVKEEFKKNKKEISAFFSDSDVSFVVLQEDTFADKKVEITLLESTWTVTHNNQINSYTAHCFIDNYPQDDCTERDVNLDPVLGEYILNLIHGMAEGDVSGRAACAFVRLLFRELEIKDASKDSWVKYYFPKFFKQEETDIERQKRKVVKEVMKT